MSEPSEIPKPLSNRVRKISRNSSSKSKSRHSTDNLTSSKSEAEDDLPKLITPPLLEVRTKSQRFLNIEVDDKDESSEPINDSPDSEKKKLRKRASLKSSRKIKISKEKAPRLLDNTIRLVSSMYENKNSIDPRIFLFDAKENDENVIYYDETDDSEYHNNEFPSIKAAIIEKLIVGLTPESYFDPDFVFTFLLNYRSFTNVDTLIELLKLRWNTPCPEKPSRSGISIDKETFKKKKLVPIRLRIYNVLKTWIDDHYDDIDSHTAQLLKDFLNDISKEFPGAQSIIKTLDNGKTKENIVFSQKSPKPYIPMNIKTTMTILDIHPEEIARQLTIMDSSLFKKIKLKEFLNLGWTKEDKKIRSPGILTMINSFNHISNWVSTEIIRFKDMKQRALAIIRFIVAAQKCYELNNFNGIMEIVASLQNSAIHRLYNTWEMIPLKIMEIYQNLSLLMNGNAGEGNFKDYRDTLKNAVPPVVPYLGLYLTDLTFLNDGNPDFLDENKKMINFSKLTKIAGVLRNISIYQQDSYCLETVEVIQEYIKTYPVISEDEQYKESILLEKKIPKEQRALAAKERAKEIKKLKIDLKSFNISE